MWKNKATILLLLFAFLPVILSAETYVVCIGIGNYASPGVRNLTKTEADAIAMAGFYKKGTRNVITITGHYATKAQILKCLRSQFSRAKANDKIVFFFSGHGYPEGFCPYDMTGIENGLKYSEVNRYNAAVKGQKQIYFCRCLL